MKSVEQILETAYHRLKAKRRLMIIGMLLLFVAAGTVVGLKLRPRESVATMLPDDDSRVARDFNLLSLAPFSRKVLITLRAGDGQEDALLEASRVMENALKESDVFTQVEGGFDPDAGLKMVEAFSNVHPTLFTGDDLEAIIESVNEETVREQVQSNLRTLSSPDGMMEKNRILNDPMNFSRFSLAKLSGTRMISGVTLKQGRFVDQLGKHGLIIADTGVEVTDTAGSERLLAAVQNAATSLPSGVEAEMLSGHRYGIANQRIIKRDLSVVLTITVIGLLAVFLIYLRDCGGIYVLLFPAAALLFALAAVTLAFNTVSAITIGFGAVLMGISVDFALHLYFSAKGEGDSLAGLKKVGRPGSFCALTTICAFAVLLQSDLPGQRQLAVFCIAGLLAAVLLAFFALPQLLTVPRKVQTVTGASLLTRSTRVSRKLVIIAWLILVVVALPFVMKLRFDGDWRKLGARPQELLDMERTFAEVWGDFRGRAMVFAKGPNLQDALELNDRVYRTLSSRIDGNQFVSISPILPSQATQDTRASRWMAFVKTHGQELCELLRDAGWPPRATQVFKEKLANEPRRFTPDTLQDFGLDGPLRSLVVEKDGGVYVISLVPDDPEVAAALTEFDSNSVTFVSQSVTGRAIGTAIAEDFKRFVTLALVAVILLVSILYRRPRLIAAALIPVFSGVFGLFAIMGAAGIQMNMFNVIASILIIGLGVDYGIFMAARHPKGEDSSIAVAVWVSGLTTLAGFGALVFAKHPALFSIGITVVIGIALAILSALFVVPAVAREEAS